MKKLISIIAIAALLLFPVSCGTAETKDSSTLSEPSVENSQTNDENQAVISLEKFKSVVNAENFGEIAEVNGDYGYDAALVTSDDGTNYIYMYLASPSMARSVLTDSDGDGKMDPDFTLIKKDQDFELYTQETTDSVSSDYSVYGRCLLAGSMILMVSGTMEQKDQIRKNADSFMEKLGYDLE